jgi:hypothetical protein
LEGSPAVFPGITNPSLYRNFTNTGVGSSIATVDFAFIGPSTSLSPTYTNKDYFSFNLGAAGGGSLAKFTLDPFGGTTPGSFALQWVQNGTNVVADGSTFKAVEIQYNALYRLVASLSGGSLDLQLQGLTPQDGGPALGITNYLVATNVGVISNGAFSSGFSEADFESFGLEWNLTSGDTNNPGANYLIMTTASVVPEPSTMLMLTVGGLMVGAALWRRRDNR